jgi:hypothetical protein
MAARPHLALVGLLLAVVALAAGRGGMTQAVAEPLERARAAAPNPPRTPTPTWTRIPSRTWTPTASNTPGPSPTPTWYCILFSTISGAITGSDPQTNGALAVSGNASTCEAQPVCPGPGDPSPRRYDAHTRTNGAADTLCLVAEVDASSCSGGLFAAAYLGSFDPNNVCTNYLGDIGSPPAGRDYFAFVVPAGQSYSVVVYETTAGAGCASYLLVLRNCGAGTPTPGPSPTATATGTRSPTPSPSVTVTPSPTRTHGPLVNRVYLPVAFANAVGRRP